MRQPSLSQGKESQKKKAFFLGYITKLLTGVHNTDSYTIVWTKYNVCRFSFWKKKLRKLVSFLIWLYRIVNATKVLPFLMHTKYIAVSNTMVWYVICKVSTLKKRPLAIRKNTRDALIDWIRAVEYIGYRFALLRNAYIPTVFWCQ